MSPGSWRNRIQAIRLCMDTIRKFTAGMTFEQFAEDPKTIRAVAFELSTMDEAERAMPLEIQQLYPQIPWDKRQSTRNVIIHAYSRIDEEILWKMVRDNLPARIPVLDEISRRNP